MKTQASIKRQCEYRATGTKLGWYRIDGVFLGRNIKEAAENYDAIMLRISNKVTAEMAIAHHEKWSKAGGWGPIGSTSDRRKAERDAEFSCTIEHGGNRYEYTASASVSCRWVRYSGSFRMDGVQKDVRLYRGLVAALSDK